jgi:hypothetical protein
VENAEALVREFELALAAGDASAAAALFSDDYVAVLLPGLVNDITGSKATLESALGFYAQVTDLTLGDCSVRLGARDDAYVVTCPETSARGFYAETVIEQSSSSPWIRFTIVDDHLTAVLDGSSEAAMANYTNYCIWSEQTFGEVSRGAFDAGCRPVEAAPVAPTHAEMAQAYQAAGAPGTAWLTLRTRRSAGLADVLFHRLTEGQAQVASQIVLSSWDPAGGPGFLGVPEGEPSPASSDFLTWVAEIYDIDAGVCGYFIIDDSQLLAEVSCREALWSGPLIRGLDLDPVAMPVTITIDAYLIAGISGRTDPVLQAAFTEFCEWARREDPDAARSAFTDACTPIYDQEAAGVLQLLLERYRPNDPAAGG